jgi:hypothetical protein
VNLCAYQMAENVHHPGPKISLLEARARSLPAGLAVCKYKDCRTAEARSGRARLQSCQKSAPKRAALRLTQEVSAIQRIPLRRSEPRVADDAAEFFFRGAVGDTGGAHDVFFKHHRTDVVAAEAQAHLADF